MGVVFAETGLLLGFFLPGDSLLFLTGALVASHVIALPLWVVALGVLAAAAAGDQVGYLVGRRLGPRVFAREDSRLFSTSHAERARRFFDRHGPRAVIIGRFVPVVRTFVPVVAGVGRMAHGRFTAYNLVGALVWGAGIVQLGSWFGGIPVVARHVELLTIGIALFSILPAGVALVRGRRQARRARSVDPDLVVT